MLLEWRYRKNSKYYYYCGRRRPADVMHYMSSLAGFQIRMDDRAVQSVQQSSRMEVHSGQGTHPTTREVLGPLSVVAHAGLANRRGWLRGRNLEASHVTI